MLDARRSCPDSAHRVGLVDDPSKRGVGRGRKRAQLRKPNLEF